MPRRSVKDMPRHQQRAVMAKLTKGQIMRAHSLARRLEKHKDGIKEPYALATYMVKKEKKGNPGLTQEAYNRMMGLSKQDSLRRLEDAAHEIYHDLKEEGFDSSDINRFIIKRTRR